MKMEHLLFFILLHMETFVCLSMRWEGTVNWDGERRKAKANVTRWHSSEPRQKVRERHTQRDERKKRQEDEAARLMKKETRALGTPSWVSMQERKRERVVNVWFVSLVVSYISIAKCLLLMSHSKILTWHFNECTEREKRRERERERIERCGRHEDIHGDTDVDRWVWRYTSHMRKLLDVRWRETLCKLEQVSIDISHFTSV